MIPPPSPRIPARKYLPIGDAIHAIASPILAVLRISHCKNCEKRRARLNHLIPIPAHPSPPPRDTSAAPR